MKKLHFLIEVCPLIIVVSIMSACGPTEVHHQIMTDEQVQAAAEKCLKMNMNTRVREGTWFDGRSGVISVYCVPPN
jgi:hypothetical protein